MSAVLGASSTARNMKAIYFERKRQEELKRSGKFPHTCSDVGLTNLGRLAVLGEEFGEVARAVSELNDQINRLVLGQRLDCDVRDALLSNLHDELVQVGAVALAWLEGLEADRNATLGRIYPEVPEDCFKGSDLSEIMVFDEGEYPA